MEQHFVTDMVMFYLYYDIVYTTSKWGKNGDAV